MAAASSIINGETSLGMPKDSVSGPVSQWLAVIDFRFHLASSWRIWPDSLILFNLEDFP